MEKLIIPSILSVSDVIPLCDRILKTTQPLTESDNRVKELHARLSVVYDRLVKNQNGAARARAAPCFCLEGDLGAMPPLFDPWG